MNRTQIIERLKLGRPVALEVPGTLSGQRTFVFIRPRIDPAKAKIVFVDWMVEPSIIRNVPNEDIVNAYEVTFTELKPGWEQYPDDWDQYLFERRNFVFATLVELEAALHAEWGRELHEFKHPGDVDHPF